MVGSWLLNMLVYGIKVLGLLVQHYVFFYEGFVLEYSRRPEASSLREIIFLKNKYRPDIIFIMNTLTNHTNSRWILNVLYFDNKLIIDPFNHRGGLWIAWNNSNIIVNSHSLLPRCASLNITYQPNNKQNTVAGVYCPAQEEYKDCFLRIFKWLRYVAIPPLAISWGF